MIDIKFERITIHHFLSFEHVEVELKDKGFCLVSGFNRNPKDFARSNGAGKSTIFNAISYALTGETLQGLKSNLPNIYFNDGCWVKLEFEVNGHKYALTRSKDDKTLGTNLKIVVDNEDKSGKGIRESQALLDQFLPELTSELIGSTIMIGQGMPMKFTANSPSGRKEVLEHFSQSDFMIQDLKERLIKRNEILFTQLREVDDSILANTSKKEVVESQLKNMREEYQLKYSTTPSFDNDITLLTNELQSQHEKHDKANEQMSKLQEEEGNCSKILLEKLQKKKDIEQNLNKTRGEYQEYFTTTKANLVGKRTSLEQEINKLKSITDICPTCHQKIPGAIKPDTSKQEEELLNVKNRIDALEKENKEDSEEYFSQLQKLEDMFKSSTQEISDKSQELKTKIQTISRENQELNLMIINKESKLASLKKEKENFETNKSNLSLKIKELETTCETLDSEKLEKDKQRELIQEHLSIISKMSTIVKRDFRGFLLKGVIDYISDKSKVYASKIFGCDELSFELNGNDINISFCGKDFDNLSGGEQQRVNLIIQFAIRDFMSNYLQFSSNILVLDEITDALDNESCDRVLNFITTELRDIESVFIISHHSDELEIPVDSELKIEKNELGVSHVIY